MKLRLRLPTLTFRKKALILLGTLQAFLLFGVMFAAYHFYYREEAEHVEGRLQGLAGVLADTALPMLKEGRTGNVHEEVESVFQHNDLAYVLILDVSGHPLVETGPTEILRRAVRNHHFDDALDKDGILDVEKPVMSGGEILGRVEFGQDVRHIGDELDALARNASFAALGVVFVSMLLLYWV
ncbi:MAG TPA: hypothetical protein ENJ05_09060, partial [Thiotrichales bacterium]|nr:hypothetical protein [Thiotrichales bacterium]